MWEIVQAGGTLMWPIMLCSVVSAAIILERLWTLQDRRVLPPDRLQDQKGGGRALDIEGMIVFDCGDALFQIWLCSQ